MREEKREIELHRVSERKKEKTSQRERERENTEVRLKSEKEDPEAHSSVKK